MKKRKNIEIKSLIFDVGGVLFLAKNRKKRNVENLTSSYKEFCLLLKRINMSGEEFWEKTKEIYRKSANGKITKKQNLELLSKILLIPEKNVENLFEKTLRENIIENKKLMNFILNLKKKKYKLGLLSNQQMLSKNILIPKKFNKIFNASVISCEDCISKPDEKAFRLIFKKLKTKPEESIFIDDKQNNIDAAERLGVNGILFKNNKQLISDLRRLGVKI